MSKTKNIVLMGLLICILVLMALTPLGYLKIGPLSITFNMIPVSIGAIALGKKGGAVLGGVFGLTSFLSCMGIIVPLDTFGATLLSINWLYTVIVCFIPRILDGFLAGLIAENALKLLKSKPVAFGITGFFAALLNTVMFMSLLVRLFGSTDYIQGIWNTLAAGKNAIIFICAFVGLNAVVEIAASTVITSAVSAGLYKANLICTNRKSEENQ